MPLELRKSQPKITTPRSNHSYYKHFCNSYTAGPNRESRWLPRRLFLGPHALRMEMSRRNRKPSGRCFSERIYPGPPTCSAPAEARSCGACARQWGPLWEASASEPGSWTLAPWVLPGALPLSSVGTGTGTRSGALSAATARQGNTGSGERPPSGYPDSHVFFPVTWA